MLRNRTDIVPGAQLAHAYKGLKLAANSGPSVSCPPKGDPYRPSAGIVACTRGSASGSSNPTSLRWLKARLVTSGDISVEGWSACSAHHERTQLHRTQPRADSFRGCPYNTRGVATHALQSGSVAASRHLVGRLVRLPDRLAEPPTADAALHIAVLFVELRRKPDRRVPRVHRRRAGSPRREHRWRDGARECEFDFRMSVEWSVELVVGAQGGATCSPTRIAASSSHVSPVTL